MTFNLTDVPEQIKERLGSEQASSEISRINDINRIHNDGAIASLLYLLEVKQISAENFTKEIEEELEISNEKAKAIAREIKEKILRPIYYSLLNWGIDINDIDTEGAPTLEEIAKREAEFLESLGIKTGAAETPAEIKEETIRPEVVEKDILEKEQPIKISVSESSKQEPPATGEAGAAETGPLILQREASPIETARDRVPSKGFTLPFGFFRKPATGTQSAEPARARIEFLKESMQTERTEPQKAEEAQAEQGGGFFGAIGKIKKDISGEQKKVVHYSELRTPITPFAKEEEFIDLESFGAAPETKKADNSDNVTRTTRTEHEQSEIATQTMRISHEQRELDSEITTTADNDYGIKNAEEKDVADIKEEKKSPWKFSFIPKLWKKADTNDDNTATQTTRILPEQREEDANWEEGPKVEGNVVDLR